MIGVDYRLSVVFLPSDEVTEQCEADCCVGGKEGNVLEQLSMKLIVRDAWSCQGSAICSGLFVE